MSKVEKTIQAAQEWRKKHGTEALDFKGLDGSLADWEKSVMGVASAKKALEEAKTIVKAAKKAVTGALQAAKAARKTSAKAAKAVEPPKPATPAKPVKVAKPTTTPPQP